MALESHGIYQPTARRRPSRSRRIARAAAIALPVLALGVGAWFGARLPAVRISEISISGASAVPSGKIEEAVRSDIAGTAFGFVPRDHFFLVSGDAIAAAVARQFPQFASVEAKKRFPKRIDLLVRERELWGLTCVRADSDGEPRDCTYLDTDGVAYEPVASVAGLLLPVIFAAEPSTPGTRVVSAGDIDFFNDAREALVGIGEALIGFSRGTTTQEDFYFELASGWEIVIPAERPVAEWLPILKTVLDQEVKDRRRALDYVDLRFGNKVFYKYK